MGLVGGVGSGKSTLARRMSDRCLAVVVDGDAAGHRALANEAVKLKLVEEFGNHILASDGRINRRALAGLVFGNSEKHSSAKRILEAITHPVIEKELQEKISQARQANAALILLDAAVLLEAGWGKFCDAILFIDTTDDLRRDRALARGWSEDEWRRREASQMSLVDKQNSADAVIDNSLSIDSAVDSLTVTIERLCHITIPCNDKAVEART